MSRKKRPSTIRQTLESVRAPYHLAIDVIVDQEDRAELAPGVDEPTVILTGDLTYE